jgi:hypothetical protein
MAQLDTRPCPHCGGAIKIAAKICKHCREEISDEQALSMTENPLAAALPASAVAPAARPKLLSCEACAGPVSAAAKVCPRCGHPVRACSACGQSMQIEASTCGACGHPQTSRREEPRVAPKDTIQSSVPVKSAEKIGSVAIPASPPVDKAKAIPAPEAHMGQIIMMWAWASLATIIGVIGGPFILVLEIGPIVIAIYLVRQKAAADKINGWIVLGIATLGLLLLLVGLG